MPSVCLQFVIVVFPDHIHYLQNRINKKDLNIDNILVNKGFSEQSSSF